MNNTGMIKLAAKLLKLPISTIEKYSGNIIGSDAVYISIPEKGGASLIIDCDGSVLYADSSVGYTRHLEQFKNGRRTPIEAFK